MNNKIVSLIGVIVVAVLAVIGWQLWHTSQPQSTVSDEPSVVVTAPSGDSSSTSSVPQEGESMSSSPVLVVYFSRAGENYNVGEVDVGNTALLAQAIIDHTGADSFQIVPVTAYPQDYQSTIELATTERETQARPAYQGEIDISPYQTIFLGYPIWWGDMPMIVYHFIENHDWQGKTVIPFNTHEGSGNSGTYNTLQTKMTGSRLLGDGFNLSGTIARTDAGRQQLLDWLDGLEY